MAKANVVFSKDNEYYTPKYVVDFFYPEGLIMTQQHVKEKLKNLVYHIMILLKLTDLLKIGQNTIAFGLTLHLQKNISFYSKSCRNLQYSS